MLTERQPRPFSRKHRVKRRLFDKDDDDDDDDTNDVDVKDTY